MTSFLNGTGIPMQILRGTARNFPWLTAAILFVASCGMVHAQGRATIFGTVMDTTGAAVRGAVVTVTNSATQQARQTVSGDDGAYVFPQLEPGNYNLTVEAPGFQKFVQKGILLQVDQNQKTEIQLAVGKAQQQIVVSANPAQVDTRSATISEVVDSERVKDLPLNGRNAVQLQTLVAGATQPAPGWGGQAENSQIAINGSRQNQNGYTLDGADNEDPFFFTPSVFPNPDALAEFSMLTSNYGAQQGLGAGSQINAITKSGTNQFHGSLFEYLRNQAFDAAGYFALHPAPFRQNQFGGTLGGPVFRNRTFFFFAYQGTRQTSSPGALTFVSPDSNEREGNFSEIGKQLKDPVTRAPVPGNVYPAKSLNQAALNFLKTFVPLPNLPNNIYSYSENNLYNDDQYIGRLDHTLSRQDHLSGRVLRDSNVQDQVPTSNDLPGFLARINYANWNLAVNETHVFSPTLLNVFTFGFNDVQRVQTPMLPTEKTWGDLGAGIVRAAPGPIGYNTGVGGYFHGLTRWPLSQFRRGFQYSDTVSWTRRGHSLSIGGDLRQAHVHQFQTYLSDGQLGFTAFHTGDALADFETGYPNTFFQNSSNAGKPSNWSPDLFVQDNWRLNGRLTVNLGLRWNPFIPYHDELGFISQFRPGQQSSTYPTAPAGYVFPGDSGVSRNTIGDHWSELAPRGGFAYDVFGNGKTSLRAGFGIFNGFLAEETENDFSSNQPFGIALSASRPTGGLANPYSETGNPFPYVPPQTQTQRKTYNFLTPLVLTVWDPSFRNGRIDQWNVNVQQQIRAWIFTVAYVGATGEYLPLELERNPAVFGAPGNSTDARRVYAPNFSSITSLYSGGHSSYHALQLSASRRVHRNFTVLANYTWSKSIDNGSGYASEPFNPFNLASNRGPSDFDIPQTFVASFIWRQPNARIHEPVVSQLLNGWEVNGILTLQSGPPFSVQSGVDNSESGVGLDNADIIGNPHIAGKRSTADRVEEFFNPAAYTVNAPGTFGNSGRNSLFGPGYENIDLGLVKSLYQSERLRALLRGEAFNAFNHTNLLAPDPVVSDSTFGQISGQFGTPRVLQVALRLEF